MSSRTTLAGLVTDELNGTDLDPSVKEWKDEYLTLATGLARSCYGFNENLRGIRGRITGSPYHDRWSGTADPFYSWKSKPGVLVRRYNEKTKTKITDNGSLVAYQEGFDNLQGRLTKIGTLLDKSIGNKGEEEEEDDRDRALPDVQTGDSLEDVFKIVRKHLKRTQQSLDNLTTFLKSKNVFETTGSDRINPAVQSVASTLGKRPVDPDEEEEDGNDDDGKSKRKKGKEEAHPIGDIDDLLEGWE